MHNQDKKFWLDENSKSVEIIMLQHMHPCIVLMIAWTNLWCYSNNVKPVWTSWMRTSEQNKALGASDVHLYRAADLSLDKVHGWTFSKRTAYERDFRAVFHGVGAYVTSPGGKMKKIPLVRHDSGHGDHYHLQVSPTSDILGVKVGASNQVKIARPAR